MDYRKKKKTKKKADDQLRAGSPAGEGIKRNLKLDYSREMEYGQEGDERDGVAGGVPYQGAHATQDVGDTLSKSHIFPENARVAIYGGSSFLKTDKGIKRVVETRGVRGTIKGFSEASRYRLLQTIAKIKRDAPLPLFLTLTYPGEFPQPSEAKADFNKLMKRMEREFDGKVGLIWKLEPQERGAPHYHNLVWGVSYGELFPWVAIAWYEIAGGHDERHLRWHLGLYEENEPCVGEVRSWRGVWSYAAKYLGKTFEVAEWGSKWTGRYWGVRWPENVPFGEYFEIPVSYSTAVQMMRYQRRYSGISSKRGSGGSLITFCNADQWVGRLLPSIAFTLPEPPSP